MSDILRAGVIGAGAFAGHHARKYAALEGVALSAVYSPVPGEAAALAEPLGAHGFEALEPFLEAVDVVTVASPASTHGELALAALKAGKPVLTEKPLAVTVRDGEALVSEAARRGLVLAVGHQERLVFAAMGLLSLPERPLLLEAVRRGPWSPRGTDVSCVLDLSVHDLDLALTLSGGEAVAVEGEGRTTHGPLLDEVRAEITFDDGLTVALDTSRIAEARDRRMRLVFPSGEVEIDFLTRSFRNTTPFDLDAAFTETAAGRDPLGANVAGFLAAVRGAAPRPPVTGAEALRALDLALAVEQACGG